MEGLLALPAEVIHHIFRHLSPVCLTKLAITSHLARSHALDDRLWEAFVRQNVPFQPLPPSPEPAKSWRALYIAHHPYWFLTQHTLWFSDQLNTGGLAIARYDKQRGCIEAYRLLSHNPMQTSQPWSQDPEVFVVNFCPELILWRQDPIIRLDFQEAKYENILQREIQMETGVQRAIHSSLSLCHRIPPQLQHPSMSLWPPATIPSIHRVRNESPTKFRTEWQRPSSLAVASDHAFRLRKWIGPHSVVPASMSLRRLHDDVSTWSTLSKDLLKPSDRRPWQGIWVGDYSAHGCEFVLVVHRDEEDRPRQQAIRRSSTTTGLPSGLVFEDAQTENGNAMLEVTVNADDDTYDRQRMREPSSTSLSGRMEAIKLTGDVNVPRGECSWFADDISDGGLIRVADEEEFPGARIVRSMGHVADRGFQDDRYISSQLILIDHDTLAHYWEVRIVRPWTMAGWLMILTEV